MRTGAIMRRHPEYPVVMAEAKALYEAAICSAGYRQGKPAGEEKPKSKPGEVQLHTCASCGAPHEQWYPGSGRLPVRCNACCEPETRRNRAARLIALRAQGLVGPDPLRGEIVDVTPVTPRAGKRGAGVL